MQWKQRPEGRLIHSHMSVFRLKSLAVKESANLDLLRSFAVLSVYVCHSASVYFGGNPLDGLGRLGVLLFFVHTSTVLLTSIDRRREGWWPFQLRRIFRIYPLSITACCCYALSETIKGTGPSAKSFWSSIFLIQNLNGADSIPRGLWTLPFEVQMYLVLPALLIFCAKFGKPGAVLAFAAAVGMISTAAVIGIPASPLAFVPCFLVGAIVFTSTKEPSLHWSVLPLAILACCVTFGPTTIPNIVPFGWFICLGVGLLIPNVREVQNPIIRIAAKNVAKYSYGIYLLHKAAVEIVSATTSNLFLSFTLSSALTAGLSVLVFHAIEDPLIKAGRG
jgi:peptidoglycan/LPS O-acetylase OafA/YrhL